MKKTIAIVAVCVSILLSITACWPDDDDGGGASSNTGSGNGGGGGQVQVTTSAPTTLLTYDPYGCEMINTASGPRYLTLDGVTYCYQQQFGLTYYGYTLGAFTGNGRSFAGLKPAVIRDFSAPANIILMQPQTGPMLWQRMNILTNAVEVKYGNQWITKERYQQLVAQNKATEQAELQASLDQIEAIRAQSDQKAIEILLQPPCNSSYNGCA